VLPDALRAERAARGEGLRAQYVALGGWPPGSSAARGEKLPAVFGAQVAE
jgi:hypothetical protein